MLKMALVRAVAKGFGLGMPAATDRYRRPALEPINVSVFIDNFKIPLHFKGAVAFHGDSGLSHLCILDLPKYMDFDDPGKTPSPMGGMAVPPGVFLSISPYLSVPDSHTKSQNMRQLRLLVLLQLCVVAGFGQSSPIPYGNNPAAGKYYNIRGFRMYVEQYGTGKPLLMIHGNNGSIRSFENNIPFFSRKYRVIVADSRSQGKSLDPKDSLSFEMMADDEAALLNRLHIDSAYVLGWSDGGIVALLMAIRHPGKVIKLAETGANLWPDSTAIAPSVWLDDQRTFESLRKGKIPAGMTPNDRKLFLLDWYQPNVPLSALSAIRCPALIIAGDHDLIRLVHTVAIYRHIRKAYLWIVPHSGHGTLIEHRDEFNRKVDQFFSTPFQRM